MDGVVMLWAYTWSKIDPLQKLLYNFFVTLRSVCVLARFICFFNPHFLSFSGVVVAIMLGTIEFFSVLQEAFNLQQPFWLWCANLDYNVGEAFLHPSTRCYSIVGSYWLTVVPFGLLVSWNMCCFVLRGLLHSQYFHLCDTKQVTPRGTGIGEEHGGEKQNPCTYSITRPFNPKQHHTTFVWSASVSFPSCWCSWLWNSFLSRLFLRSYSKGLDWVAIPVSHKLYFLVFFSSSCMFCSLTERCLGSKVVSEREMSGKWDQEERECVWGSKEASERGRSARRNTKDV